MSCSKVQLLSLLLLKASLTKGTPNYLQVQSVHAHLDESLLEHPQTWA